MSKRDNPQTSKDAYHNLDPVKISEMHKKIEKAVRALGSANYEGIALYLGMAESKVWKRLKEAADAGLIYKTGETVRTKNNCKSYVYSAVGEKPVRVTSKKERFPKGKTAAEHASSIIKQTALFNL